MWLTHSTQRWKHQRGKRVLGLDGLFCGAWRPPTLPCLSTFFFSFLGTSQCQVLAVSHTRRHPENWLSGVPPPYSQLYRQRRPLRWWRPFPDAFTAVSVLAKPDVTAAEGLTVYLLSGLSVVFLSALYCGFPWSRSCCLFSPILCVVLFVLLLFAGKATDSNVPENGIFGRGHCEHFPYSGQMRGLTADICKCDSLGGFRFHGPIVSVPSEEYTNLDSMRVDFRMVSVFWRVFSQCFSTRRWTSDPEVPELCPCFCSLLESHSSRPLSLTVPCPVVPQWTYHASCVSLDK